MMPHNLTNPPQRSARIHGVKHVFAAARYSAAGFRRLMAETAARHELLAGAAVAALLAWRGASAGMILGFGLILLALLAVEALNTAIEVLTDRISPEWSLAAKEAKDLGSLAVGLLLVGAAGYVGWVLVTTG